MTPKILATATAARLLLQAARPVATRLAARRGDALTNNKCSGVGPSATGTHDCYPIDPHELPNASAIQRITRYREHYNNRRPHQALKHATPRAAWELLEHTPATEPSPLAILEGKAAQYRQVRRLRQSELGRHR